MNLSIQRLKKEEVDVFNKADEAAFNVHARYFPEGIVPGAAENDRDEYNLSKIMDDPKFTVLSIKDDGRFIGGAVVEDMGKHVREIAIFFLIVEYQSRGIGKTALDMVEAYFPDTRIFRLITPSNVVRNVVFYVNKCGYRIIKAVDYDREANTADYVFEKRSRTTK
jgi:GNAT superfamily N-acetyltransferase